MSKNGYSKVSDPVLSQQTGRLHVGGGASLSLWGSYPALQPTVFLHKGLSANLSCGKRQ